MYIDLKIGTLVS